MTAKIAFLAGFALEVLEAQLKDLSARLYRGCCRCCRRCRSFGRRFDFAEALLEEDADDFFGVVRVHLAAEGFDVELLFH